MKRHMEALRNLMGENRAAGQQIQADLQQLQGGDPAELEKAIKKHAPQAEGVAAKMADEFTLHYENLAKIYKENREQITKKLAEGIVKRMAERGRPDRPPRGEGEGRRGERPAPGPKNEAPPGNF
jgi:hypothetical protein